MRHNYTYEAFGDIEGRSGVTQNTYRFTGEQFDENLGDYYTLPGDRLNYFVRCKV
jgi:hypothetical protein